EAALQLLPSLQVDSIVSARIKVDQVVEYIQHLQAGKERKVQIVF
ncbi:MAG: hypothetical protein RBG13Loki_0228, partial [Promethearchaeota archaeon CR_4]